MARKLVLLLTIVAAACNRPPPAGELAPGDASAPDSLPSSTEGAPPASSSSAHASAEGEPSSPIAANLPRAAQETERRSLKSLRDDKLLGRYAASVTQHFDGGVPSPLEVQTVTFGDLRALLTYAPTPPAKPFLFVVAADGTVAWSKERPLAGTRQIVTEMVLTPGPASELALLWCDIPTQIVGLRRWASDGVPLADFEVMEVDLCDALAGLYWPGRGWVVVASQHGAGRAQLFDERGSRSWAPRGIALPWTARPAAPAAVAVDSDASVIVLQVGERAKAGSIIPDRLLAMRYDAHGAELWDAPIDLGDASAWKPSAHVVAVGEPGRVRVTLPGRRVTLSSTGGIEERR